jgi:hypothetical protein
MTIAGISADAALELVRLVGIARPCGAWYLTLDPPDSAASIRWVLHTGTLCVYEVPAEVVDVVVPASYSAAEMVHGLRIKLRRRLGIGKPVSDQVTGQVIALLQRRLERAEMAGTPSRPRAAQATVQGRLH